MSTPGKAPRRLISGMSSLSCLANSRVFWISWRVSSGAPTMSEPIMTSTPAFLAVLTAVLDCCGVMRLL